MHPYHFPFALVLCFARSGLCSKLGWWQIGTAPSRYGGRTFEKCWDVSGNQPHFWEQSHIILQLTSSCIFHLTHQLDPWPAAPTPGVDSCQAIHSINFFCAWSFFVLGAHTYHSAFRFAEVWTCILAMQHIIWTRTLAQAICLTHFERNSNISHSLKLKQGITLRLLNNILVHRSCRCKTASLTSPGLFVWAGSGDSIEGFGAIPLRRDGLYSQHEHAEQSTWVRATDWVFTAIIFQG